MGAKTWMLAYLDGDAREILRTNPPIDRAATFALAKNLLPTERLYAIDDGDLSFTSPPENEICIGCFPGLSIIAAREFGIDQPSKLDTRYLDAATGSTIYLHAMHSVGDWFAYAIWINGKIERSLSLSPDNGIIEDIGARRDFEEPYWAGQHPLCDQSDDDDGYPFPFHPLDLGEEALLALFGFQLEGLVDPDHLEPESIPLSRFKRSKPWWKLW